MYFVFALIVVFVIEHENFNCADSTKTNLIGLLFIFTMRGMCNELCPQQESKLRIREKLLHYFEYKNGQKNVPGILVKSFARSAAGVKAPDARSLRTEDCLQRTIAYLFTDIVLDKRRPFHVAYDFIFDRLRAVRQETIIQNFNAQQTIRILEPIIMFLAYSRYRLCEETIQNFDPKICEQHLQECLKRILNAYDDETVAISSHNENRCFFEALYQVHNLGSSTALARCLQLSHEIISNDTFANVHAMAKDYHQGNFYRVMCSMQRLPHLIAALSSLHMQKLRRKFYEIFSHAYSSKQLMVPVEFLCKVVKQNSTEVISDCKYFNQNLSADLKMIRFFKSDFNADLPPLPCKHEFFVEEKLMHINLSDLLLLKEIK